MKIRHATESDKGEVLRFCANTFEWGDYIDQVWDFWISDRNGVLLVAEHDEEYNIHGKKRSSVIAKMFGWKVSESIQISDIDLLQHSY